MTRLTLVLLLISLAVPALPAQQEAVAVSTGGLAFRDQELRFLGHHKRVLMVGAHPDDEDTELLTIFARGLGAETAYLALTRGEGGQNLIGPELGPGLGVLRTGELLGARGLDGGRQFFTRAFDFGYSKTLEDAWAHWPRDTVLKDVIRVVRRFRPQVMVAVFSGTPRDGHGQHQASGWAAREAFRLAGQASAFPELAEEGLEPWSPAKLYQIGRFDPAGGTAIRLDGGVVDPAVGQSFLQIAMRGRSLHRSQDMGALQRIGPSSASVRLIEDRTGAGGDPVFSGADTSLGSLASRSDQRGRLDRLGARLRELRAWDLAPLAGLRAEFAELTGSGAAGPAAADQLRRMDGLLFAASDVLCDATATTFRVLPGSAVPVVLSCWNASPAPVTVAATATGPGGDLLPVTFDLAPGQLQADTVTLAVPVDAPPSTPYFLARPPMTGAAVYQWSPGSAGEPFAPAPFRARFVPSTGGQHFRDVVYRYNDQAVGEVRRPVTIVPRVSVAVSPGATLMARSLEASRTLAVTLRLEAGEPVRGLVAVGAPSGWTAGRGAEVVLSPERPEARVNVTVRPPVDVPAGRALLRVSFQEGSGAAWHQTVSMVDYPHTWPRQLVSAAEVQVEVADLSTEGVGRVGWVRGAADAMPEALAAIGVPVTLLGSDDLGGGDLGRFDVIVVGPRAYETEPGLREGSARLLDFARAGGTVIVQYQQQAYFGGGFAPFPLSLLPADAEGRAPFRVSAPRVADEHSPVRVLDPEHALLTGPNRLGPADWAGWVQERGLYFARSWGPEWTPLLELQDPGEEPVQGALLLAPLGAGLYVYSGISFFRHLPAAVPGSTRLFLNLLALRR